MLNGGLRDGAIVIACDERRDFEDEPSLSGAGRRSCRSKAPGLD
jgi:hypothetical protein